MRVNGGQRIPKPFHTLLANAFVQGIPEEFEMLLSFMNYQCTSSFSMSHYLVTRYNNVITVLSEIEGLREGCHAARSF